MEYEYERQIIRKAMAYDLQIIFRDTPDFDKETVDKISQIMYDYVKSGEEA